MNKFQLLILSFFLCSQMLHAQESFFKKVSLNSPISNVRKTPSFLQSYALYKIDAKGLKQSLQNAPVQYVSKENPKKVTIPMPDGTLMNFDMFESSVLAPNVAAVFPEIKTYSGKANNKSGATLTINFTSTGLSILALDVNKDAVYFERYTTTTSDYYFSYFGKNSKSKAIDLLPKKATCGIGDIEKSITNTNTTNTPVKKTRSTGENLRTFRLALCATAEFANEHGGTKLSAFNDLVAYVARINAIYKKELSCAFTLVTDTNYIFVGDTAADPFSNNEQTDILDENQEYIDSALGAGAFDIGHVWGSSGGSGEGLAANESLCNFNYKAQGASNEGDINQYGQIYFDQLFAHELGHQFGMSHSYNSSIPVCTTRELATSVEPGSGATIMSYGFTCGSDDYQSFAGMQQLTGPILHFHAINYLQSIAFLATKVCGVTTATNNTPPEIIFKTPNDTIPKSTPFQLDAQATDADSNALTYCWEGMNIGGVDTPVAATILLDTEESPFFRSYEATADSFRIYPILTAILDSVNVGRGDKLPSISVVTKHQITVRDGLGGVTQDSVVIYVDSAEGPFLVTSNLDSIYQGNATKTITWSVNNTDTRSPNVQIYLSIDGGLTFPYLLDSNATNNGSANITFPNVATTTARLKVRGKGKIFFDISDSNFTITTAPLALSQTILQGQKENTTNHLFWKTVSGNTITNFEIEKSEDAIKFEKIGTVAVVDNTKNKFDFKDANLKVAANYYRLKEINITGTYAISNIVKLENENVIPNIYPNPANTKIVVENIEGQYNAMLCDVTGKVIFEQTQINGKLIIATNNFSNGLYLLKITKGSKTNIVNQKITISH